MDFTFSAEQEELRRAVRDLARDHASSADVRRVVAAGRGYDDELWRLVGAELGLTGLGVAEPSGGAGGDFVDVAVVLEESGAALLPVPLLSTLVAAAALAGSDAAAAWLPDLCSGTTIAVLAVGDVAADGDRLTGELPNVLDGQVAGVVVVAAPAGLWLVEPGTPGATVVPQPTLDLVRGQASVRLDGAAGRLVGDSAAASRAVDLLRVALAVEAVGVARRCLELTVEHLKTRVQFGRPIGAFQALQHRAADLVVALESAASTAYYAAWAAADEPAELPVVAPLAKAVCADAAYRIAAETIQMHGGIGFTWEHDAHLYFKRATTTRLLLGDSHRQRQLVALRAGFAADR